MVLLMPKALPTVLLTRPRQASEAFAARLLAEIPGIPVLISPVMKIVSLIDAPDFGASKGAIFTSKNGVRPAPRSGMVAYCVGPSTAELARSQGWRVDLVAADAEELLARLKKTVPSGPLLHLRGTHTRTEIAAVLTGAGIPTDDLVVYDQAAVALTEEARHLLAGEQAVVVPLFSPRSAAHFMEQGQFDAPVTVVAISGAVAEVVGGSSVQKVVTADAPNASGMLVAINNATDAA
jgi:uroporphyrinogen-III synthase